MRRRVPAVLVSVGLALLLGWYLVYTRRVIRDLRAEARSAGEMYAQVYRALATPDEEVNTTVLLELSAQIRESGIPLIVTDESGRPTDTANLPVGAPAGSDRVRQYVGEVGRLNAPVVARGGWTVHYGDSPLVMGLRVIPLLQAGSLLVLLLAGIMLLRTRSRVER